MAYEIKTDGFRAQVPAKRRSLSIPEAGMIGTDQSKAIATTAASVAAHCQETLARLAMSKCVPAR